MAYKIENRRYTGSKAKLASWIMNLISKECTGNTFADIFAGTGIISSIASNSFKEIIINDFLYSNNIIYQGFFGKGEWGKNKIKRIIENYNTLLSEKISNNFFSENFGGKYFGENDSKKIGHIREDIELTKGELTKKEYAILLSSLLYSVDKIANTVGHYDAYIQKNPKDNIFALDCISPVDNEKKFKIFLEDTNDLVRNIKADIVYIDPPYNSRQYSRFYHILETLAKWNKPALFGTALKPAPENISEYCKKTAKESFSQLVDDLNAKFLVVSYNNTYNSKSNSSRNKITLQEIDDILSRRGKTKVFEKGYRHFNAGNTHFDNHKEYL